MSRPADVQDRRSEMVEKIRLDWIDAPPMTPKIRNTYGYTVEMRYECRADAEAVKRLLETLDGDMADLLLAVTEGVKVRKPAKSSRRHRVVCAGCGEEFNADRRNRKYCSIGCNARDHR